MERSGNISDATDAVTLFRSVMQTKSDETLFTFLSDGATHTETMTYGELDRRARALAHTLSRKLSPSSRALLVFAPSLDFTVAFWGCLYAGIAPVVAFPPGEARARERLLAIAGDADASCLLTTGPLARAMRPLRWWYRSLRRLKWLAVDEIDRQAADRWSMPRLSHETTAFLQYTSGSIGTPKGVVVSHRNLLANTSQFAAALRATGMPAHEHHLVSWLPVYHDMGLLGNVLFSALLGSRCTFLSPLDFLQKPLRWLEAISRHGGTISAAPNFAYDLCVRRVAPADLERLDLSRWRVAMNGAEPVRGETMARFADKFAPCGFRREAFAPSYGLAEATLYVAKSLGGETTLGFDREALARGEARRDDGEAASKLALCGTPLGQTVRIVDPATRTSLADGAIGEVWIKGPNVAEGYWRKEAETETTFRARLACGDGPYLRTGDLGFLCDGQLVIAGREKDLIIVRGRNHYPQDIEASVNQAHQAFRPGAAAAFAIDAGSEEKVVVVQEIDRRRASANAEEILRSVRRAVQERHGLVLHELVLVDQGQVPKTTSGKIQRRRCREKYLRHDLVRWQRALKENRS